MIWKFLKILLKKTFHPTIFDHNAITHKLYIIFHICYELPEQHKAFPVFIVSSTFLF